MTERPREHLVDMLDDFDTAMLVTRTADGGLDARPMGVADVTDNGELWFCSGLQDRKIAEINGDPNVLVSMQGKTKWVSISGRARITTNRADIERLWKPAWKVWFPQGKDDPTLGLIVVDPSEGQYWDNSGTRGIKLAVEAIRALFKGEEARDTGEVHQRVKL